MENNYNSQFVNFEETFHTKGLIEGNNKIYNLVGVIDYFGNRENGHYTASCIKNNIWYYISDTYVEKLNNFNEVKSENAYILFYSRD